MENDPIEELLLRAYPNPERKGCPGSEVILSLANKAFPPDDSAWEHIWKCSPCFADFKELRDARLRNNRAILRKRNLSWAIALFIVLICAGALTVFLVSRPKEPVTNISQNPLNPAAVLNLESASIMRSPEKNTGGSLGQIQTLPRHHLELTVYLPRGSEDGDYQLEFLNSQDKILLSITARAVVMRGLTAFSAPLDLTNIAPGTYAVRSRRLPDGKWRVSGVNVQ